MNTSRFLRISNGDFIRPENVVAITARDKQDKWTEPQVTVIFENDHSLYIDCETLEEAENIRGEIMSAINIHFAE